MSRVVRVQSCLALALQGGRSSGRPASHRDHGSVWCYSLLYVLVLVAVALPAPHPSSAALGQTVGPAVVEYQEEARGKFELVNETLFPMTVVIEPRGFRVEPTGELMEELLDTTRIRVKISAMSFRIPPRETYTVFYEARATSFPAWFLISSTLSGARTQAGLNVWIELPHVVYMLQPQALRKSDVAVRSFEFGSSEKRVSIEVENLGASLGRVLSSEVSGRGRTAAPGGAFPLFPFSRRRIEIPWANDTSPEKLVLRFATFTVEERRRDTN